jgi:hypothetical protein
MDDITFHSPEVLGQVKLLIKIDLSAQSPNRLYLVNQFGVEKVNQDAQQKVDIFEQYFLQYPSYEKTLNHHTGFDDSLESKNPDIAYGCRMAGLDYSYVLRLFYQSWELLKNQQ